MNRITDPQELARRSAMLDQKVRDDIAKHGWSDTAVFPVEGDPGVYFNYTVGLIEQDHPDLIVVGMPPEVGHRVLWAAYHAIEEGYRYKAGTYATNVLEGLRVAVLEVSDPLDNQCPMTMCHHLYGEVHGLQIVWPDADDRFPWHEDFDESFRERQPLLGKWSE